MKTKFREPTQHTFSTPARREPMTTSQNKGSQRLALAARLISGENGIL
jgi:hypothetical protein